MQISAVLGASDAVERATQLGNFAAWVVALAFMLAVLTFILIGLSRALSLLCFIVFAWLLVAGIVEWVGTGVPRLFLLSLVAGLVGGYFAALPSRSR